MERKIGTGPESTGLGNRDKPTDPPGRICDAGFGDACNLRLRRYSPCMMRHVVDDVHAPCAGHLAQHFSHIRRVALRPALVHALLLDTTGPDNDKKCEWWLAFGSCLKCDLQLIHFLHFVDVIEKRLLYRRRHFFGQRIGDIQLAHGVL